MHALPRGIAETLVWGSLAAGLLAGSAAAQASPVLREGETKPARAAAASSRGASASANITAPAAADEDANNPSAPAPQVNAAAPVPASRVDLYGGYAFLKPSGNIGGYTYSNIDMGAVVSATAYLSKHVGIQAEGGFHPNGPDDCFFSAQGGAVYRFFYGEHLVPFVHATGGGTKVGGPRFQPCTWGYGFTTGGGLDYILPKSNDRLALRLIQADYEYMHVNYGPLQTYALDGGTASVNAVRLSAGLVLRLGDVNPRLEKNLSCDANPAEVYAGEKVTVAANAKNYDPNTKYLYRWELTGGKVEGYGPVVFVNTDGLSAGTYTATAHVAKGAKSKQMAQCSATYAIKASPAPAIKCSANPSTINPGDPSTITSYVTSIPQRKLTYSYSATAGHIGGDSSTAQLNSAGVAPGIVTVTCRVQDDLGQTAEATTTVTISAPPVPPVPTAQRLCTVLFNRDPRRPARVDNEGRACLDDIALTLDHQPDARLVVVGEHGPAEMDGQMTAAERAVNTRAYLSKEKGIDPSRVDLRTSSTPGQQVETYLLIPGAVFDQPTEGRIDESKVRIHGQQYATEHKMRRRPAEGPVGEGVSHPPR